MSNQNIIKDFLKTIDQTYLVTVVKDLKEGAIDNLPDSVLSLIDKVIERCQEKAPKLLYDYLDPYPDVQHWRKMCGMCGIEFIKFDQLNREMYFDIGERDNSGKCVFKVLKTTDVIVITPEVITEERDYAGYKYNNTNTPQYWLLDRGVFWKLQGNYPDLFKPFTKESYK